MATVEGAEELLSVTAGQICFDLHTSGRRTVAKAMKLNLQGRCGVRGTVPGDLSGSPRDRLEH